MGPDLLGFNVESRSGDAGNEEHAQLPSAEHESLQELSNAYESDTMSVDGAGNEMVQDDGAPDIAVCIDVEPLDGVFYNTVKKIDRDRTDDRDELERDLIQRDPTRHFRKSICGAKGK